MRTSESVLINPLNPDIKIQFLLSCPHTFIIVVVVGRREFILGDHTLNSYDLSDA